MSKSVKANIQIRNMQIELEAPDVTGLVDQVADVQEVFSEPCCGLCHNTDIIFRSRTVDNNIYREMKCLKCFATLSFGLTKKGNRLFPKRKLLANGKPAKFDDPEGKYGDHNGWTKWHGASDEEAAEEPPQPQPKAQPQPQQQSRSRR